ALFRLGDTSLSEGLEQQLLGLKEGEKKAFSLEPDAAFGVPSPVFHPLSNAVAQYQDRLYAIRKTEFGENQLDVVTLDNPNLVIDK
ncbi:FKBP-type peptidyl-prolyl cis-trans isomerase, partial [Salmonella enterica subsp. enterica serovar Montevideo]|nr:FKBP-type peptidyl-prolyl cis-trans isomerase [Salmonella enterica subsp. enterica serovar Montevideo]